MRDQFVSDGIVIENALAFWVHRVYSATTQASHRAFRQAKVPLTPEQWAVLVRLWEHDGRTQNELCDDTFRDKPTMSRLLAGLERRKLVSRRPSPSDARRRHVFLTPAGRALKPKLVPVARELVDRMLAGVSDKELAITRDVLRRVFENLQR